MSCKLPVYILIFLLGSISCKSTSDSEDVAISESLPNVEESSISDSMTSDKTNPKTVSQIENLDDYIPEGYMIFEKSYGDLNGDGRLDCMIIIKGTDPKYLLEDENRGILDLNRRGLIVLFKDDSGDYTSVLENYNCFHSDDEDGGVYYTPDLSVSAEKGNLVVYFAHGRYGWWSHTFRYKNNDFELIGYDASHNSGPVINQIVSINFLTKKKKKLVNINHEADSGDEVFEESWSKINYDDVIFLSGIKDFFEDGDLSSY